MLEIRVPYKAGDTITVKLVSSEEIIARLSAETADTITVEKPVILIQGQQGVGMMPWLMSGQEVAIDINKDKTMVIVKTQTEVAKAYIENTSDIKLA